MVNADELLKKITECKQVVCSGALLVRLEDVLHCIESCDVENITDNDVVHSKWMEPYSNSRRYECSNCGLDTVEKLRYCPNCGSIMDLE